VFATKKKLITTLSAGALALGLTAQASASINPDVRTAPSAKAARILTGPAGHRLVKLQRSADQAEAAGAIASPESYGVSQSTLDAIASCESGGNPAAVSPDGTYRGLYQFDQATWESVGGSGDPAAAPAAEQSMRAAMLMSRAGSSPWPICG
jgi:soluble lytic murein transglycosylase-like protein